MPTDSDPLEALVERVPEGWTAVSYAGRRWGLTRTTHLDGRSVSIYAEELGGPDVVSANVFHLSGGAELKPCEMPESTVLEFLEAWQPVAAPGDHLSRRARRTGTTGGVADDTPSNPGATPAAEGLLPVDRATPRAIRGKTTPLIS